MKYCWASVEGGAGVVGPREGKNGKEQGRVNKDRD